jgi:L-rhamnose-H+ transport protein
VRHREDPLGPNPFLGVIFHWIGGFCSATNFIPFRGIKRWSWEVYWIIQGVAAWLIAPTCWRSSLCRIRLRSCMRARLRRANILFWPMFWGLLWGVGGLTFGLAIRYLGLGLGYAIALGFCTGFGTIIPPIYYGQWHAITHEWSGQVTLLGVLLSLIAIAVSGAAGASKEREVTAKRRPRRASATSPL